MPKYNKYGLSRNIPSKIKQKIRTNSGFGCIVCGRGVTQYEHVDPIFAEAKKHDPDKMTQLCGYCHDLVSKGMKSKDSVKEAMKNPKCLKDGFTFAPFDFGKTLPIIEFGGCIFKNTNVLLRLDGIDVIKFDDPTNIGDSFLFQAIFLNKHGVPIFQVRNNKWFGSTKNWDINIKGTIITLREKVRKISLKIENIPGDRLIIHQLEMGYKGILIKCNSTEINLITPSGINHTQNNRILKGTEVECGIAFEINTIGTSLNYKIGLPGKLGYVKGNYYSKR